MKTLRQYWSSFVVFAVALMSLFSGFLVSAPTGGGANIWYAYGKFLVAVCIGLWLVPMNSWNKRDHKWRWWVTAVLLLILSTVAVLKYNRLVDQWSVLYFKDQRVVVGQTLQPAGQKNRAEVIARGGVPYDITLLRRVVGDARRVWVVEEVDHREFVLTALYLLTLLLLASTVVIVAHAAYCSAKKR